MNLLEGLNLEKRKIVETEGSVLVIANPGTGKTRLLAYKYVQLLQKGVSPDDILCLTFTEKAKKELNERILKLINETNTEVDLSKIQVHTFHSYALTYLTEQDIVSNNLLRYSIYRFLKDNEILNYADSYLLSEIVPRMENLIRYLKSFGIKTDEINLEEVRKNLTDNGKYSKEEIDAFAEHFINIYKHYEETKGKLGIDYSDMLNDFLEISNIKKYPYVLVDELQDVNTIEAEIALKSAENYIAVGDKKQAIFGFQGGSINNFKKFQNGNKFVLGENFRSSNPILDYAKYFFLSKTEDKSHEEDLASLQNKKSKADHKPVIYDMEKDKLYAGASELAKQLSKDNKRTAIITRTNYQIVNVSNELKNRGIDHTTTFFSASADAKENIIAFLKGIFSNDPIIVKNSLFTPFSPVTLQEAFEISDNYRLSLKDILEKCPEFKALRESVTNFEDVARLFDNVIIPSSVNYGKQYLLAALNIRKSCNEACDLNDKSFKNFIDYMLSSDMLTDQADTKKKVIVTTVHKSKGLEFDNVIYIPTKPKNKSNFQDDIVEAILKTKGINAEEELEEEALRIDFVAFTRAVEKLCILTSNPEDYLTNYAIQENLDVESIEDFNFAERNKKAYSLFIQGEYDKAKSIVENNNHWLKDYIQAHFDSLERISFSAVQDDAMLYLQRQVLKLRDIIPEAKLGTKVHDVAESLLKGEEVEETEELKLFIDNIKGMIKEIKESYPEVYDAEHEIMLPLSELIPTTHNMTFKALIDAVFKNDKGEYLIVDWKTDKKENNASKHRRQLETYKRAFCMKHNIPEDKVKVAIGYVGLRSTINTGKIDSNIDDKAPRKTSFETFSKKLNRLLEWKSNPELFLKDLKDMDNRKDPLWRAVIEQYEVENE